MKFETQIEIPGSNLCVVSCNGLLCLSDQFCLNNSVYVCNPITRQHFRLPESKNERSVINERPQLYIRWCGIGYSRSADLFKVVSFTANLGKRPFETHCSIYTLGVDDEWRTLGLRDAGLTFPHNGDIVFLNGAFHWIGQENSLCSFDMEKEQCGNLPLPSQVSGYGFHLGVVDNCLYIIDEKTSSVAVNIWVLKDYGNMGSWTLEWIIQRPLPPGLWNLKPVKTVEDGTVLMIAGEKNLASYNPVSTVLEKITYHGVKFWGGSITGVPSFLPLP